MRCDVQRDAHVGRQGRSRDVHVPYGTVLDDFGSVLVGLGP
jgi:hypothetical protein